MSDLWDAVKSRHGGSASSLLRQITNPEKPNATSIDDTVGEDAVDDVIGDLALQAGITFDSTVRGHVSLAVDGVVAKLRLRRQGITPEAELAERKAWTDRLRALAGSRAVSKTRPAVRSSYTPSTPNPTGVETRPPFDVERFDSLVPNAPET